MSETWKTARLGELCDIYQPHTISRKELNEDGAFPVFGANGIIGRYDRYNHEDSQVLITCRGATCGTVNKSFPKSWITGNAMVIRPKCSRLDLDYLEYFCRGAVDFSNVITGSAQPQITRESLSPVQIKYPSVAEQKRIVAILDEAFAGIDTAIANTEKNIANARDLSKGYMNSMFSNDTWRKQSLSEVAENLDRQRVPITKAKRKTGEVPYYGASGIVDYVESHIFDEDLLLVSEDGANLVARTYPIAFSIHGKTWVNNHAHVLRFEKAVTRKFVEHYLNWVSLAPYVSGMAQPKLNQKALNSILIPFPDLDVQENVVNGLTEIMAGTDQLIGVGTRKLFALRELKESLLQKAFSGELIARPSETKADEAVA